MLAIPGVIAKDQKRELDQEFELDIRVSSVTAASTPDVLPSHVRCTNGSCYTCYVIGTFCVNTAEC